MPRAALLSWLLVAGALHSCERSLLNQLCQATSRTGMGDRRDSLVLTCIKLYHVLIKMQYTTVATIPLKQVYGRLSVNAYDLLLD